MSPPNCGLTQQIIPATLPDAKLVPQRVRHQSQELKQRWQQCGLIRLAAARQHWPEPAAREASDYATCAEATCAVASEGCDRSKGDGGDQGGVDQGPGLF